MNKYFIGKKFSSEQEFLKYLISLENQRFDCPDGYYWGDAEGQDKYYEFIGFSYYENYEKCEEYVYVYDKIMAPTRFAIDIKNGHARKISFFSWIISSVREKNNGIWEQARYSEFDWNWRPREFTHEEIEACIRELSELLVIESKKVG